MKAVILAAGKSTRTYPLTYDIPKPLLKIANKTIIKHNLEQLDGLVDEVIFIVGFKADMIKEHLGSRFGSMKLTYIWQEEQLGTGHAVMQAKDRIDGRFIVFGGDDLFSREDIKECIKHPYAIMVKEVRHPERFGICECRDGLLIGLEEKPEKPKSNLANTGCLVLDKDIFDIELRKSPRGEFELTDYPPELIKQGMDIHCHIIKDYWLPIGYPEDILKANDFMLERLKKDVLVGSDCIISPDCSVRDNTSIGDNCTIGDDAEISNSVIMDKVKVGASARITHSVLGPGVTIGDGASLAKGTVVRPGVKIAPGKSTSEGEKVENDII